MSFLSFFRTSRRSLWTASLALLGTVGPALSAQVLSGHDGFSPNVTGTVFAVTAQSNGQVIVGGSFTSLQPNGSSGPIARANVARVNADGSVDTAFDPEPNGMVLVTVVQPNGQILIGGRFSTIQPNGGTVITRNNIARFNADGTLDASFDPNATGAITGQITAITLQPNGQILIAGSFTSLKPNGAPTATAINRMARLNADGTLDAAFKPSPNAQVDAIVVQPNGKILIAGGFTSVQPNGAATPKLINYLARLNADGTLDAAFNPGPTNQVKTIALQPNGQILIGGHFTGLYAGATSSFVPAAVTAILGTTSATTSQVGSVLINSGGSGYPTTPTVILVGGNGTGATATATVVNGVITNFTITNGGSGYTQAPNIILTPPTLQNNIARLNADGSVDTTFLPSASGDVNTIVLQPDGRILVGGIIGTLTYTGGGTYISNYIVRLNTDGTLDTSFVPNPNYTVNAIAVEADGEIVIGGQFTQLRPGNGVSATNRNGLARLGSDGSIDSDFDPNAAGAVGVVTVQTNGKVLVGGSFSSIGGITVSNLARLNTDGTVDTTFNPGPNGLIKAIALQANGQILIGGAFTRVGSTELYYAARLNADGTVDPTFNPSANGPINAIAVSANGQIYLGGSFSFLRFLYPKSVSVNNLARVNVDGTVDTTFEPNPSADVYAIVLQPSDTAVIAAGAFTDVTPASDRLTSAVNYIVRLDARNGQIDTSWIPNPNGAVYAVAMQPDGQFLLGGAFTTLQPNPTLNTIIENKFVTVPVSSVPTVVGVDPGATQQYTVNALGQTIATPSTPIVPRRYIARVNASNGSLDTNFDPSADGPVLALAVNPSNGQIVAGGVFRNIGGQGRTYIARINSAGNVDTGFNAQLNGFVNALAYGTNNQFYAGGAFTTLQTSVLTTVNHVARFNGDGTLDTAFSPGAATGGAGSGLTSFSALAVQPNGKFLVAGAFTNVDGLYATNIARFLADGTQDNSFAANSNGPVYSMITLADGTYLVGGDYTAIGGGLGNNFTHLLADTSFDISFRPNPDGPVVASAVQANGQMVIGGTFTHVAGATRAYLARLNAPTGTIDANFNPVLDGTPAALAIQNDGKILIGGGFRTVNGVSRHGLARLNADGSLDTTYDPFANKTAGNGAFVNAIVIQPDGRALVGGNDLPTAAVPAGTATAFITRIKADGTADSTFTGPYLGSVGHGAVSFNSTTLASVFTILLQADGRILIGGNFTQAFGGATVPNYLARLSSSGALDTTFAPNPDGQIVAIALNTDAKPIVAGLFTTIAGASHPGLARLGAAGAAVQSLAVSSDLSTVTWSRGGTAPELSSVTFQWSTNNATWTTLGQGSYGQVSVNPAVIVAPGANGFWTLTGIKTLPSGSNFYVRAIGVSPTTKGASAGLVISVAQFNIVSTPVTQVAVVSSATLLNSASTITAVAGGPFYYQIAGEVSALSYSATGLPAGLSINGSTGLISGTPTETGTFQVSLTFTVPVSGVTAQSSGNSPGTFVVPLQITVNPSTGSTPVPGSRLINLSSLNSVTPTNPLFDGFVIVGSAPKTVLLRAVGPGLTSVGVAHPLGAPMLQLYDSAGQPILTARKWDGSDSLMKLSAQVGAFPLTIGSTDVAVATTLSPGSYTLQVTSSDGTSGSAIAEIYDADVNTLALPQRLVDIASRGTVTAQNPLIGGFVVAGTSPKRLLIRATGPALTAFGVTAPIATPILSVYDGQSALLAQNAGWGTPLSVNLNQPPASASDIAAAATAAGAFTLAPGSADSAVIVTLPAGSYTAVVTAPASQSGAALVEIYELP